MAKRTSTAKPSATIMQDAVANPAPPYPPPLPIQLSSYLTAQASLETPPTGRLAWEKHTIKPVRGVINRSFRIGRALRVKERLAKLVFVFLRGQAILRRLNLMVQQNLASLMIFLRGQYKYAQQLAITLSGTIKRFFKLLWAVSKKLSKLFLYKVRHSISEGARLPHKAFRTVGIAALIASVLAFMFVTPAVGFLAACSSFVQLTISAVLRQKPLKL